MLVAQPMIPTGITCDSTEIKLNNSDLAARYELMENGVGTGIIVPGNGGMIYFGYQHAGSYTIRGFYPAHPQCDTLMAGSLTIHPLPTVNAGNDTSMCPGHTIQITGTAANYNPTTILWSVSPPGAGSDFPTNTLTTIFTPTLGAGAVTLTLQVQRTSTDR